MTRKTKTCNLVKLENPGGVTENASGLIGRMLMRTCWRPRHHDGDCMDDRGSWRPNG